MKVRWLGHASFLITSESGVRIITDPFIASQGLKYREIDEAADIVTVSHDHFDHNNVAAVAGNPQVVNTAEPTEIRGIGLRGVKTFHDTNLGKDRGPNIIFCMLVDGVRLCHLGDLGHDLSEEQVKAIGEVDVLLVPVGGFFTIDARVATDVVAKIKPRVAIPMHFKNDRCDFPIAPVDDFLAGKPSVRQIDGTEVEFKAGQLPAATEVVVLQPQC